MRMDVALEWFFNPDHRPLTLRRGWRSAVGPDGDTRLHAPDDAKALA